MKKIIPFKKDILFKTSVAEIVSISLDHELNIESNFVKGNFIISGEYKMLDTSINNEDFLYKIPFTVDLDEKYILDKAIIDIDDFYYEIINDSVLKIGIDVLIDQIEEKEEVKERCIDIEEELPKKEELKVEEKIYNPETNETYKSYTVYILRENDTIEDIIKKYETTRDEIEKYNDLTDIKIGDKIIIPCS